MPHDSFGTSVAADHHLTILNMREGTTCIQSWFRTRILPGLRSLYTKMPLKLLSLRDVRDYGYKDRQMSWLVAILVEMWRSTPTALP